MIRCVSLLDRGANVTRVAPARAQPSTKRGSRASGRPQPSTNRGPGASGRPQPSTNRGGMPPGRPGPYTFRGRHASRDPHRLHARRIPGLRRGERPYFPGRSGTSGIGVSGVASGVGSSMTALLPLLAWVECVGVGHEFSPSQDEIMGVDCRSTRMYSRMRKGPDEPDPPRIKRAARRMFGDGPAFPRGFIHRTSAWLPSSEGLARGEDQSS